MVGAEGDHTKNRRRPVTSASACEVVQNKRRRTGCFLGFFFWCARTKVRLGFAPRLHVAGTRGRGVAVDICGARKSFGTARMVTVAQRSRLAATHLHDVLRDTFKVLGAKLKHDEVDREQEAQHARRHPVVRVVPNNARAS